MAFTLPPYFINRPTILRSNVSITRKANFLVRRNMHVKWKGIYIERKRWIRRNIIQKKDTIKIKDFDQFDINLWNSEYIICYLAFLWRRNSFKISAGTVIIAMDRIAVFDLFSNKLVGVIIVWFGVICVDNF